MGSFFVTPTDLGQTTDSTDASSTDASATSATPVPAVTTSASTGLGISLPALGYSIAIGGLLLLAWHAFSGSADAEPARRHN